MLIETLKRHWWIPVIRGIAAIVFGIIAFTHPGLAATTLVLFFGAWVLIDGIFRVVGAIGHRASDPDWGWHLVIGFVGIIVGLLTFHAPGITALALVIYVAAWALMIGVSEIVLAVKLRREIKGEWFLILMGLISIAFAVLLLWNPIAGAAALIWLIAWLRGHIRGPWNLFWLPLAHPACSAGVIVGWRSRRVTRGGQRILAIASVVF